MKDKYWLIIVTFSIFALLGVTLLNFNNLKNLEPKFEFPELNINSVDFSFSPQGEEVTDKQFVDGTVQLSYPSSWLQVDAVGSLNEQLSKDGSQILLFLQNLNIQESTYSLLYLQKVAMEEDDMEEIVSLLEEDSADKSVKLNIREREIEEDSALLTVEYLQGGTVMFQGKEKLILADGYIYVLDIISANQGWAAIEEGAESIIESFQIISS